MNSSDENKRIIVVAEGQADVYTNVVDDDFIIDTEEKKESSNRYVEEMSSPLNDSRFAAHYHFKKPCRPLILSSLVEGQHYGGDHLFVKAASPYRWVYLQIT
jgi:hypothetical protein